VRKLLSVLTVVMIICFVAAQAMAAEGGFKVDANDQTCNDPIRETNLIDNDDTTVTFWLNIDPSKLNEPYDFIFFDKGKQVDSILNLDLTSCGGDFDNWHKVIVDFDAQLSDGLLGSVTVKAFDNSGNSVGADTFRLVN